MTREKMVTRTITQTSAEVMQINVETAEVSIKEYTIGGEYTQEKLLTKLKAIYETDTEKLVHIESTHTEEILLGMTVTDFIRHAKVLPPRLKVAKPETDL